MNLRHIDPRSTDWMDAMLEGESGRTRKREREPEQTDADPTLAVAAAKPAKLHTAAAPPTQPPGR